MAQPSTNFITLTEEQFTQLLTAQGTKKSSSKDLKFAEQKPFTGKAAEVEDFLRECEFRFDLQDDIYDTSEKKIFFALSHFKGALAELWKKNYLRDREGDDAEHFVTWTFFKEILSKAFPEVGKAQEAMRDIQGIKQGKMGIDEFNTKFQTLLARAGLHDDGSNTVFLIHLYETALNPRIASQIIVNGAPVSLDAWMKKASEIDSHYRRINTLYGRSDHKAGGSKHWTPRLFQTKPQRDPNAMEIDRLSPQEQERYKREGKCFTCGQTGHMARAHKDGTLPQQSQQQKPAFQGQRSPGKRPPQKKNRLSPEQTRLQIRALIQENLDMGSEEFSSFQKLVEEKGLLDEEDFPPRE